jgi:hypothetical protein
VSDTARRREPEVDNSRCPFYEKVAHATEFLYLFRGGMNGYGALIFARMPNGDYFRFCSLHFSEEVYVHNGRMMSVVEKIMADANPLTDANSEDIIQVQIFPENSDYFLYEEWMSHKTFRRLLIKMKVRMALSDEITSYVSCNTGSTMGVRVVGQEDYWLQESGQWSRRSREMSRVFYEALGGEQFWDLTNS